VKEVRDGHGSHHPERSDRGGGREALRHLPLEPLVRGKRVAVKPNETYATADDKTGVTQPDTLRAVLRHLKQFGPRELVVSGGAGAAETEDVFRVLNAYRCLPELGRTYALDTRS
jgi:uncharacterized protein (DUF362 family)